MKNYFLVLLCILVGVSVLLTSFSVSLTNQERRNNIILQAEITRLEAVIEGLQPLPTPLQDKGQPWFRLPIPLEPDDG